MFVIGITVATAALIWGAILIRRGGLLAGCLLVILTGSCLGHPFFHVSVVTLDRLLWVVVGGLYLLYRQQGLTDPKPLTSADLCFGLFLLILCLSTFTHAWQYDHAQPVSRLLFLHLMPAGLYWVARQSRISPLAVRRLLASFAIFGAYLSLTALAEVTGLPALVFPSYIISGPSVEFLGRGRGPYLNPSANGIYITTCLGCLWMLWPHVPRSARWSLVLGTLLHGAGAAATLTRCVWLGVAVATILAIWLTFPRNRRLGAVVLIGCAGAFAVALSWQKLSAFKRDQHVSVSEMAESAKLRPMLAAVAWQMFRDQPIFGVGFGQYTRCDDVYIAQRRFDLPLDRIRPYHQHNVVLSLLTETGLLGTLPFLLTLGLWTRAALGLWGNRAASLELRQLGLVFLLSLTAYLANGMFQDVALMQMVNTLLFLLAGLLMSAAIATNSVAPVRAEFRHRRLEWMSVSAGNA